MEMSQGSYQPVAHEIYETKNTLSKLLNHQTIKVRQQANWGEVLSLGCCEFNNRYSIKDMNDNELFRVMEDSDCMNRCCCAPGHTYELKLVESGQMAALENIPVFMHRDGCCADGVCYKCLGCFTCGESCQDASEVLNDKGTGFSIEEKIMNGCSAEMVIFKHDSGNKVPIGVVHGPTFFGGCIECCLDSDWLVSRCDKDGNVSGTPGAIGRIRKKKPEGCYDMICEFCTDFDRYEIEFGNDPYNADPNFRGVMLGALFHTDFQFFEYDNPMCGMNSDNSAILITICNFYCYGCVCPIQCCIPTKSDG